MRTRRLSLPILAITVLAFSILTSSPAYAASWVVPVPAELWQEFKPGHQGVDLGAVRGTPIRAASAGTVDAAECNASLNGEPYSCDTDGSPSVRGCGWYVDIVHEGAIRTRYCHMQHRPLVNVGDRVSTGAVIGFVGNSGHSSAPHLHFETHTGGVPVEPIDFMSGRGAPLGDARSPAPTLPPISDIAPDYHPVYSGTRYWVTTFASAPGYTPEGAWAGTLRAGRNWVLCQHVAGTWPGAHGQHNNRWLWTGLDSPPGTYAWVPAYFLTHFGNDEAYADPEPDDPAPEIEWCFSIETAPSGNIAPATDGGSDFAPAGE